MPALPSGTVTYLFTDVEGSTRLWEQSPAAMGPALARHDTIIERAVARHGGHLVRPRALALRSCPCCRTRSACCCGDGTVALAVEQEAFEGQVFLAQG
jgi:class 3 adenylate cyclase